MQMHPLMQVLSLVDFISLVVATMLYFIEIFDETKETVPILKRLAGPFLTLSVF
jgi:hypothetical protein